MLKRKEQQKRHHRWAGLERPSRQKQTGHIQADSSLTPLNYAPIRDSCQGPNGVHVSAPERQTNVTAAPWVTVGYSWASGAHPCLQASLQ